MRRCGVCCAVAVYVDLRCGAGTAESHQVGFCRCVCLPDGEGAGVVINCEVGRLEEVTAENGRIDAVNPVGGIQQYLPHRLVVLNGAITDDVRRWYDK